MNNYELIPGSFNTNDYLSVLLGPLQKYFIIKGQKEIILKKMEYSAEARKSILKTIENIASSGHLDRELRDSLMEAYYRTL